MKKLIYVHSASIIKSLDTLHSSDPTTALAYFYFDFRTKLDTDEMLRSLVKQICCQRSNTPVPVEALRKYQMNKHYPDTDILTRAMAETIIGFSRIYIVVDALDECPEEHGSRRKLLDTLGRLHKIGPANLHMVWTSRKEWDIAAVLQPLMSSSTTAEISISASNSQDINLYLEASFNCKDYESWPHILKDKARATLVEKSEGM
jgi:hypothetical protein